MLIGKGGLAMELMQLRYFATVARLGNISRAAQELYVTQPNLSKSIARLEEELGVPLFDHRKGKITLNDYGRCFLASVNLSLGELENGIRGIQRMYDSSQNILTLGCSIDDLLPDVLRDFTPKHPEIGIRQFSGSPTELAERLGLHELDLMLTARPVGGNGYVFEALGRCDFVILCGQGHWLTQRTRVSVQELAEEKIICDRSRMDVETLTALCQSCGFSPNIAFEVDNSDLIFSLLSNRQGVAFMPMAQMRKINREYPDSGIHMVLLEDPVEPASLGLVYRKDDPWSHAARIFSEFLREWLSAEERDVQKMKDITLGV